MQGVWCVLGRTRQAASLSKTGSGEVGPRCGCRLNTGPPAPVELDHSALSRCVSGWSRTLVWSSDRARRECVIGVEQWAEIRRLYFVEKRSKRAIHRLTGVHRDTVTRAVSSGMPPGRCRSVVVPCRSGRTREHWRKRRLQAPASFSAWLVTPRPGRGFISTRTGFAYARRLRGTRTLFTTCSRTPTSCMAWAKSLSRHPRKHEPSSKSGSALGERTGSVPSLSRPRLPTGRWSARPVS
jgi:hypothetical protein